MRCQGCKAVNPCCRLPVCGQRSQCQAGGTHSQLHVLAVASSHPAPQPARDSPAHSDVRVSQSHPPHIAPSAAAAAATTTPHQRPLTAAFACHSHSKSGQTPVQGSSRTED